MKSGNIEIKTHQTEGRPPCNQIINDFASCSIIELKLPYFGLVYDAKERPV